MYVKFGSTAGIINIGLLIIVKKWNGIFDLDFKSLHVHTHYTPHVVMSQIQKRFIFENSVHSGNFFSFFATKCYFAKICVR